MVLIHGISTTITTKNIHEHRFFGYVVTMLRNLLYLLKSLHPPSAQGGRTKTHDIWYPFFLLFASRVRILNFNKMLGMLYKYRLPETIIFMTMVTKQIK